jgi:hypothetical protein
MIAFGVEFFAGKLKDMHGADMGTEPTSLAAVDIHHDPTSAHITSSL